MGEVRDGERVLRVVGLYPVHERGERLDGAVELALCLAEELPVLHGELDDPGKQTQALEILIAETAVGPPQARDRLEVTLHPQRHGQSFRPVLALGQ